MATSSISSLGIGSGLDVNSIISSLVAIETKPLTQLTRSEAVLQAKLSGIGTLQGLVSSFNDALSSLIASNAFRGTTATSSDSSSVSASSGVDAAAGSYSVAVGKLASGQTLVTAGASPYASPTSTVGSGTITLRLGTWNDPPTAFTPKTGSTDVTIAIGAGEATLAGIRDKINAADGGVTAAIVSDASGARLSLRSAATGAENAFRVTVVDDDGNAADVAGLSALAYDPQNAAAQMTLAQAAGNTEATINGIAVTSASNTIAEAIGGVTLKLSKLTTSPVSVSVATDTGAVKNMLQKLASAYNELAGFLNEQTKYDAANKSAALFQGDSGMLMLQSHARSLLGQASGASQVFGTLSSIGLQLQRDGTLKVDAAKLDAAAQNLPELQKALANPDSGTGGAGIVTRLTAWAKNMVGAAGPLPSRRDSIQRSIAQNEKDQARVSQRIDEVEKRLRAQYGALDKTMSNANALSRYVSQQITTWNNTKTST